MRRRASGQYDAACRPPPDRFDGEPPFAVNPDPTLVSDPIVVLLAWSGGVAAAAAFVTGTGLVGPGFTWLAAATSVVVGIWAVLGGDPLAGAGLVLVAVGGLLTRWNRVGATAFLSAGALALLGATVSLSGVPLAISATAALGGITGEMLLGHWYLVDPTLPRTILRNLALVGIAGLLADAVGTALILGLPEDGFFLAILVVLAATTLGLMVAVIGALRYPAYSGVMAATGLSYLAVLTGLAVVFFARVFTASEIPF